MSVNVFEERIRAALEIIERYGGIDGAHHKQCVLDQGTAALAAVRSGGEWNGGERRSLLPS